jgi:2-oxo-4-hydroxy-4-carboxy-5-ureidoimidazoline decarboxylase
LVGGGPSGRDGLRRLKSLSLRNRVAVLFECCASTRWAAIVAARLDECHDELQFYELIDDAWWVLSPGDWQEAIDANPRPALADVSGSGPALLREIANGLRAYEERFSMTYVARGHGRSAAELLLSLRRRLANPPAAELRVAAAEQAEITRARLAHALGTWIADHAAEPVRVPVQQM